MYQEGKTEPALDALRELGSPRARVIRDGATGPVDSIDVVRGDLPMLAEGERVAADAIVISGNDMQADESLLTGKSLAVRKLPAAEPGPGQERTSAAAGGDDLPFLYSGTLVVKGHGIARVTATGAHTEIGRIGAVLGAIAPERSPLQRQTARLVTWFALIGAGWRPSRRWARRPCCASTVAAAALGLLAPELYQPWLAQIFRFAPPRFRPPAARARHRRRQRDRFRAAQMAAAPRRDLRPGARVTARHPRPKKRYHDAMCANYTPSRLDAISQHHGLERALFNFPAEAFPGYMAPILRESQGVHNGAGQVECVPAMFGMVPHWADTKLARQTYNARTETVATKPSFRNAWKRNQFCIIPAQNFYEPSYETGKPVRWRISDAGQQPLGIAGIWEWRPSGPDGLPLLSFSMLTINADGHPLMDRFHKPGDEKRMLVLLEPAQYRGWLEGELVNEEDVYRPFPAERLVAVADPLPPRAKAGLTQVVEPALF